MALLPPPSFQTGSALAEPVPSEFKLWREGVRYTVKYDINLLLRPTFDLKKNHRIVIYRSSSSGNPNSHLSQILIDAHPRLKEAVERGREVTFFIGRQRVHRLLLVGLPISTRKALRRQVPIQPSLLVKIYHLS